MKKLLSLLLAAMLIASVACAFSVSVFAGEKLSARGYSVPDNETENGWEHEYLYVVFSKDVKEPGADVKIAVVGNWTYSNYAYVTSDKVEVVSSRVWRFTNTAFLEAAKTASNSFYDQLNIVDGFYPKAGVTNLEVRLFGTVEATDGEKLEMIEDAFDESQDANHTYPERVHFDASGTNYGTGYDLQWTLVDTVASIMPADPTPVETEPAPVETEPKKEETAPVNPQEPVQTGDALAAVIAVASVALIGAVLIRKH